MTQLESVDRAALLAQLAQPRRQQLSWIAATRAAVEELSQLAATVDVAHLPWRPGQARFLRHDRSCRHKQYHLTCAEFDMLEGESDCFCDICGYDATDAFYPLHIDHDHGIGWRAVRGMVCIGCNQALSYVDSGIKTPSRAMAHYLADPWHARVGLEPLGCPLDCGNTAHRVPVKPRVARHRKRGFTERQQREHLIAQL